MTRWYLNETDYPATRRVMGPERESLDDEELESLLEGMFPNSQPGYIEDFMQTLQQFGRQAAPIVQRVAPGMAQGAMQGGMVAGPWGALAGALAGGATSLMSGGGPTAPPPAAAAPAAAPVPAAVPPMAGLPAPAAAPAGFAPPPGTSSAATAQLLTLLAQPETMQALLSLIMGQSGRPTIPLGRRDVPAPAFANAIAELAAEAAQTAAGSGNGASGYWFDPHGAPRCDLANPTACAALLWGDLAEAAESEAEEEETESGHEWEWEEEEEEDAIATFEAALAGRNSYDY